MAKIGNEAKLILKLVRERAERLHKVTAQSPPSVDNIDINADPTVAYRLGLNRANVQWLALLDQVVSEIESK